MRTHLQLGVLGLGRRWQRYREALANLQGRLEIKAVWDPVYRRAQRVARKLGCSTSTGVLDVLERSDIQAILMLSRPWHGTWSLEQACRLQKPICCAFTPLKDTDSLTRIEEQARQTTVPVLMALPFHSHPLVVQTHRLVREQLGQPQILRCELVRPVKRTSTLQSGLIRGLRSWLLGWLLTCRDLFGEEMQAVHTLAPSQTGTITFVMEFSGGRTSLLSIVRRTGSPRSCRLGLLASGGSVNAVWPRRFDWSSSQGNYVLQLPRQSVTEIRLRYFFEVLQTQHPFHPDIAEFRSLLPWLQTLEESLTSATS